MIEPDWLDKAFVLFLHERVIEATGGSHGVRDTALLESVLSRPQNAYHYEQADLHDLAAAYAEGQVNLNGTVKHAEIALRR